MKMMGRKGMEKLVKKMSRYRLKLEEEKENLVNVRRRVNIMPVIWKLVNTWGVFMDERFSI